MKKIKIPTTLDTKLISLFIEDVHEYLPHGDYVPAVTQAEHDEVLLELQKNNKRGFSFVFCHETGKIKHAFGVRKWLGYPDKEFSMGQYLEITHPTHKLPHWLNGSSSWALLDRNKDIVKFYDATSVYIQALEDAEKKYMLWRVETSVFQFTKEGKCLQFLQEFSIIKPYDNEVFTMYYFDKSGHRADLLKKMEILKKEKFAKAEIFSKQEMKVLKIQAGEASPLLDKEIAKRITITKRGQKTLRANQINQATHNTLNPNSEISSANKYISESAVSTYNKRIILKAQEYLFINPHNTWQVARYLHLLGVI